MTDAAPPATRPGRLTVSLGPAEVVAIDRMRESTSRARFARGLIERLVQLPGEVRDQLRRVRAPFLPVDRCEQTRLDVRMPVELRWRFDRWAGKTDVGHLVRAALAVQAVDGWDGLRKTARLRRKRSKPRPTEALETPAFSGKRSAQHACFQGMLPVDPSRTVNVLCLPGRSGWDFGFFHDLPGLRRIVALEHGDASCVDAVRRNAKDFGPHIEVNPRGINNTTQFFAETHEQFDVIYLDYYSYFGPKIEADFRLLVMRKVLRVGGILAFNLLGAREPRHVRAFHRALYGTDSRVSAIQQFLGGLAHLGPFSWSSYRGSSNAPMNHGAVRLLGYFAEDDLD